MRSRFARLIGSAIHLAKAATTFASRSSDEDLLQIADYIIADMSKLEVKPR